MLSKDYRLRLTTIACKTRLNREVSLDDRIWAQKLVEHNNHARGIWDRLTYRYDNLEQANRE